MKRTLSKISILLVMVILFSACTKSDGINAGSASGGMVPPIAIRMRSDKTEFDIDDVTLDFSFGTEHGLVGSYIQNDGTSAEKCPVVSVAVYFYNAKYIDSVSRYIGYADHKEIEGWHFVKDITPEDYEQNYKVEYRWVGLPKFDHTETLTSPEETFELTTGYVCFGVFPIAYVPSENSYIVTVDWGHFEALKYEKLENGRIKITKPGKTIFFSEFPR